MLLVNSYALSLYVLLTLTFRQEEAVGIRGLVGGWPMPERDVQRGSPRGHLRRRRFWRGLALALTLSAARGAFDKTNDI